MDNITYRASFIQSSIKLARLYGFEGLDYLLSPPGDDSNVTNLVSLLYEWRTAIIDEARVSNQTNLILTLHVRHSPYLLNYLTYSIDSIMNGVDWVHLLPSLSDTYFPNNANTTSAHASLYNPNPNGMSADQVIRSWINLGLTANRIVLGIPYHGYAWKLKNEEINGIGAPVNGPANGRGIGDSGWISYKDVKEYVRSNGEKKVVKVYNSTYVMNYVAIGSTWIGYDDVEAVRAKVNYAKERGLMGYYAAQIDYEDANWTLSRAAEEDERYTDISSNEIGLMDMDNGTQTPNLKVFSFATIQAATKSFSQENKLGHGGYGPVYKGKLKSGHEIAVKRLSKSSLQGFEEFKNEVIFTAKLQHVNLVKVMGFCLEKEEKMLIYEFMPNKSLDHYLFDSRRRLLLNWEVRVQIIEGITQGLLYLQEYSRMTVIHRDIKASNILLDNQMKPKISDFGMARIFKENEFEAITNNVVGTYGYIPPEYISHGIYSTKSDVYGFGVLILQIISGKSNNFLYGADESLSFLEYAYKLWREDRGREFMDTTLDDTTSTYKLTKFLQVALLCVQECASDRPSMLEISSMLRNETVAIKTPKTLAFSIKRDYVTPESCLLNQGTQISSNDFTITEIVAR
ncbi:cysteine-rich receptor-like protein kinase 25 [Impatiens glandulifera]|uniref:cysteine-rich receptor-like protein kinase 25 n=1 Tax=Impatiens glandulifera TaxID=253017 RepID=UPI001FB16647|nr:cysteine-rich receptor-like protein kinase 25 [Impatiens glandulifera]